MDITPKLKEIKQRYRDFEWHYLDGQKFSLALAARVMTNKGELHFGFRYYISQGRPIMREIVEEITHYMGILTEKELVKIWDSLEDSGLTNEVSQLKNHIMSLMMAYREESEKTKRIRQQMIKVFEEKQHDKALWIQLTKRNHSLEHIKKLAEIRIKSLEEDIDRLYKVITNDTK